VFGHVIGAFTIQVKESFIGKHLTTHLIITHISMHSLTQITHFLSSTPFSTLPAELISGALVSAFVERTGKEAKTGKRLRTLKPFVYVYGSDIVCFE